MQRLRPLKAPKEEEEKGPRSAGLPLRSSQRPTRLLDWVVRHVRKTHAWTPAFRLGPERDGWAQRAAHLSSVKPHMIFIKHTLFGNLNSITGITAG